MFSQNSIKKEIFNRYWRIIRGKMFENIKILHLVRDDIFTDSAYNLFESVAPSCNTFLLVTIRKKTKNIKETPIKIINPLALKNPFFIKHLEKYDIIVLHSLNKSNQELISHASSKLKFVWIGMGFDYYDLIYENKEILYQEQTQQIVETLSHNQRRSINYILRDFVISVFYKNANKKLAIEKISYFAPVIENEYKMVASKFNFNFPEYVSWNYGSTTKIAEGNMKHLIISGNNILLGNSASPENNHVEILEFLRTQKLNHKKIICPLSYGNYEYASIVKNKGRNYFEDCFLALDDFMPYDEYMSVLSSCSNVIMNHNRQQASGNIVAMLYMGAKIFLNDVNPLYAYFKEKGGVIFTINDLYNNPSMLDLKLTDADVQRNQQMIKMHNNKKLALYKTENLIKTVIFSSNDMPKTKN